MLISLSGSLSPLARKTNNPTRARPVKAVRRRRRSATSGARNTTTGNM